LQAQDWSLRIEGLVDRPESALSYAAIMPMRRQVMTMQCIGNWIGGPLVGNAEWGGTSLPNLLDQVRVGDEAIRVKFTRFDGYTTSIPVERAMRDEVLLVWEMKGELLPSQHGYPIRLINPGHYGQKMPKWITWIDEVYLGHWERLPSGREVKWSDDAIATVNSRIDAPLSTWDDFKDTASGAIRFDFERLRGAVGDEFTTHGIATAGERTVDLVEVSTDDGVSWSEARITTSSEPDVWVTRAFVWNLPTTGTYRILARVTDSAGVRQPHTDEGDDRYDGRTRWYRLPVDVATG
jgi:DMSO/TMAO reductase YedYZ molybdopterin-dependent catalytic subunit